MPPSYPSWGRYPQPRNQTPIPIGHIQDRLPTPANSQSLLPRGLGRSYGDVCLNSDGNLLLTRHLDQILKFDQATGVLRCEAGMSLEEVLNFAVPRGWFLPVTPGTKFVTVGGAVANDVHGKNHHVDGNFSHHVVAFELLRSSGERLLCSPTSNPALFYATIGGLGLTGLMTWVEFRLKPIHNAFINQEVIKTTGLSDFFALSHASERDFTYTMSWIDCLAKGKALGRGLYMRGNHAPTQPEGNERVGPAKKKSVPFDFPGFALNSWSIKAFNTLYYHKQQCRMRQYTSHYDPFFYPLDAIHHWNRIYGARGFLQWQCLVPYTDGQDAIRAILSEISRANLGSFLGVLKTFGDLPSLGMLSFPKPGVTLALDFSNVGQRLYRLLDTLDGITRSVGGSIYPAKDARMSAESFAAFFPRLPEFIRHLDPAFSSSFWRRVNQIKE